MIGDVNTNLDALQNQINALIDKTSLSGLFVDNGSVLDLTTSGPGGAVASKTYPDIDVTKSTLGSTLYNYKMLIVAWASARRDTGGTDFVDAYLEVSENGGGSYSTIKRVSYNLDETQNQPMLVSGAYNVTQNSTLFRLRLVNAGSSLNNYSNDCVIQASVIAAY